MVPENATDPGGPDCPDNDHEGSPGTWEIPSSPPPFPALARASTAIIDTSYHWLCFVTPIVGAISPSQSLQNTNGLALHSGSWTTFCRDNRHILPLASLRNADRWCSFAVTTDTDCRWVRFVFWLLERLTIGLRIRFELGIGNRGLARAVLGRCLSPFPSRVSPIRGTGTFGSRLRASPRCVAEPSRFISLVCNPSVNRSRRLSAVIIGTDCHWLRLVF